MRRRILPVGGERVGGVGEHGSLTPPTGPGQLLDVWDEDSGRGLRMRLGGVRSVGLSGLPHEGSGHSLVCETSAAASRSAGMENRPATSTSWTSNSGRQRRSDGPGRACAADAGRCHQGKVVGRNVSAQDGYHGSGFREMVQESGGGVVRRKPEHGSRDGRRGVLHAETAQESSDSGILGHDVDTSVRGGIPKSPDQGGGGGNVRVGERFASSRTGAEACGTGSSRSMEGDGGGSRGQSVGSGTDGVRRRKDASGIVVGSAAAENRMASACSDSCVDAMVRADMGQRQGSGTSASSIGHVGQAQRGGCDAGANAEIDQGNEDRKEGRSAVADGHGERSDRWIAECKAGAEEATRCEGPEVQSQRRRDGSGRRRDRSGSGTGAQTGIDGDTAVRGDVYVDAGAAGYGTCEDMIRMCRLPLREYGIPGYAHWFHAEPDAVFPKTTTETGRVQGEGLTLPFAETVVHTVDVNTVKEWLTQEEWEDVEVLINHEVFERRVLRKHTMKERDQAQAEVRNSRISEAQWSELRRKRYVRKLRRTKPKFVCAGFAVVKSDGLHLRFIWNGVAFNTLCNPPPKFSITQMPTMIRRLVGRKRVRFFVAWDYSTWFVQLMTCKEVSRWFGVKSRGNSNEVMNGEPMGWNWACCIAQWVSYGIMRNVLDELGVDEEDVSAEVCIDNCIIAVHSDALSEELIVATLRAVCARHGAVLKESALEVGKKVEWMVYVLNAEKGTAKWKKSFRMKLREASELRIGTSFTYRQLWGLAGLVLFAMYAASVVPVKLRRFLNWIVQRSPTSVSEWDHEIKVSAKSEEVLEDEAERKHSIPEELMKDLRVAAASLYEYKNWEPKRQREDFDAWVIADASTSGYDAYIVITSDQMILESYVGEKEIHHREMDVQLKAMERAVEERMVPAKGANFLLYGDNTVANRALSRGYALWSPESDIRFEGLRSHGVDWEDERVETGRNVSDAWTRVRQPVRRRHVFAECGHYTPGVLCVCATSVLQMWAIDGEGFEDKLRCWKAAEKERSPRQITGFPYPAWEKGT